MTNPFALLDLPETLLLEPSAVEEAWRNRRKEEEERSDLDASASSAARGALSDPVSRLEAWLAAKDPGGDVERGLSPLLMDLFAKIGPVLARADSLLTRHRKATTTLARAVLAKEAVGAQLAVQALMQELQSAKGDLLVGFPGFETAARVQDFAEARRALGALKFLRRWEEQCRERLLALLAT